MSEVFSIEITNHKAPAVSWIVIIIAALNFISFGYAAIYASGQTYSLAIFVGLFLSITVLVVLGLKFYNKQLQGYVATVLLVICATLWIICGTVLPGLMLAAFSIFSVLANKKQVIVFDASGIKYPSFPAKLFLWSEIDFVLLKDDILSLEMKNNRLLQFTLERQVADKIDAAKLNRFCENMTGDSSR